jgi:hypothetical protein
VLALIVIAGMILVSLVVLFVLLAGLSRRALALTERLAVTKERAAALDQALANLPAERS